MRARPVIGITSYVEDVSFGEWDGLSVALVPSRYVDQIRAADAIPVLVPPLAGDTPAYDVDSVLSRLDALLIPGGADVESSRYGEPADPRAQAPRPDRDTSEIMLIRAARDRIPVLGICRGMQIMAVAFGGTLHQHIPDLPGITPHSAAVGGYRDQEVSIVDGTRLAAILGARATVRCYHHQGVATHPSLTASAFGRDGIVEAIESAGSTFFLGVQWHPERGTDPRLFQALVAATRDS